VIFSLEIAFIGKATVGTSVAVGDGSGVDVIVADGTDVFFGTTALVAIGMGVDVRVEHPTRVPTLRIIISDMKSLYGSFDVISFLVLI
jgi:hypothetical protein